MPAVAIRPYRREDAEATLAVFFDAIMVTAAEHYTAAQREAWARPGRRDLVSWDAAMQGRAAIVAVVEDEVAGFSDVSGTGYIDMMFVSPAHARRGVALALLTAIEETAHRSGVSRLTSDVSLTARGFFERFGFAVEKEQHPVIDGVQMTNFRMVKALGVDLGSARP
ncbi:GNAT family N-acetyltransferase [Microbacterium sp. NPDC055903]